LSAGDKKALLDLARKTIAYAVEKREAPTAEELGVAITPAMESVCGAFVTLNENGDLRGCIGDIFPSRPLYKAVMGNAINAALRDPRFNPVQADEVPKLKIEISVLTPPHPIDSYKDIVIGKDGVVLSKDGRKAVFLPQVAPEQGWDVDTTLDHLAVKAGLPADAWREGAQFEVFQADVFSEE
jgi:AmmeMemoRadiSam system protein A